MQTLHVTPALCRAARGYLDWSQTRLAIAAGIGLSSITRYEKGDISVSYAAKLAIETAFRNTRIAFAKVPPEMHATGRETSIMQVSL